MKFHLIIKACGILCVASLSFCFFSGADPALQENNKELTKMSKTEEQIDQWWFTCEHETHECVKFKFGWFRLVYYGDDAVTFRFYDVAGKRGYLNCRTDRFKPGRHCLKEDRYIDRV